MDLNTIDLNQIILNHLLNTTHSETIWNHKYTLF